MELQLRIVEVNEGYRGFNALFFLLPYVDTFHNENILHQKKICTKKQDFAPKQRYKRIQFKPKVKTEKWLIILTRIM